MHGSDHTVLVVDDDPDLRRLLSHFLGQAGYSVLTAEDGAAALRILHEDGPRIAIIDWQMPVIDGANLCKAVRRSDALGFVYLIVLTGYSDKILEAFEVGADDFMCKPPKRAELLARLKAAERIIELERNLARRNREIHKSNAELAILNATLDRLATTDDLTGLLNRREGLRRLELLWKESQAQARPLSCLMVDIDHFKSINDRYGHDAGDAVLRETARTLEDNLRTAERPCRLGGEEFLVLNPGRSSEETLELARRTRAAVEELRVRWSGQELRVTISVGIASSNASGDTVHDMLRRADDAMYTAKREGRNTIRVAGPNTDGFGDQPSSAELASCPGE